MPQHPNEEIHKDAVVEGGQVSRTPEDLVIPLHAEELAVSRRIVERARVRVATVTHQRDQVVNEALTHERIEIEHVPIDRIVDALPPVRQEGDVTIMSVVEEILVMERRLLLKEEVHIRRVRTTEQHVETVVLREQEAVITRIPDPAASQDPSSKLKTQGNP